MRYVVLSRRSVQAMRASVAPEAGVSLEEEMRQLATQIHARFPAIDLVQQGVALIVDVPDKDAAVVVPQITAFGCTLVQVLKPDEGPVPCTGT